jgi:hypothetical protein
MIELGGKHVMRIWAKHEPEPGHLRDVIEDMKTLGRPTIRCVDWRGELYAIEGSHRLKAAFELGIVPNIEVTGPDRLSGEDERFWDWMKDALNHYAWEVVAEFRFGGPAQPPPPLDPCSQK